MGELQAFKAELAGLVNAGMIELSGSGLIDVLLGYTEGTYQLLSLPRTFSPGILSACLITGYPHASSSAQGTNIFSGCAYRYNRDLKFRDGGHLQLSVDCGSGPAGLVSRFALTGDVNIPYVGAVQPIVESWEPRGPGRIRGHFTVSWRIGEGRFVTADALTDYEIDSPEVQDELKHRLIVIESKVHGGFLHKRQRSRLFHQWPDDLPHGNH